MTESELKGLLDDLECADAESDAMSRLVVTRLAKRNIPYRAMLGSVEWQGKTVAPHFWVEVGDCVIDYCAGRVFPGVRVPAGVLSKAVAGARYQGQEIVIDAWPDYLYSVVLKGCMTGRAAA